VIIDAMTHVEVPPLSPLATVHKVNGFTELSLWPGGVGTGPSIRCTLSELKRVVRAANAALVSAGEDALL
jgi:hypothetical protein